MNDVSTSKVLQFDRVTSKPQKRAGKSSKKTTAVASDWKERPCTKSLGWIIEQNQMANYLVSHVMKITTTGQGMSYFDVCGLILAELDKVFLDFPHSKEVRELLDGPLARTQKIIVLLSNLPATDEAMGVLSFIYRTLTARQEQLQIPTL